jgi:hypothetical protein
MSTVSPGVVTVTTLSQTVGDPAAHEAARR